MEKQTVWIVDWDIPLEPHSRRRAFYRALKKLRKGFGLEGSLSTASVLIVEDEELAWKVYELASSHGRSNIYQAIQRNGGKDVR